jgi:glycosyltransferase involved in cell wall biosynthesis
MEHCIDSLLAGGEDVEILIVNDGSFKDNTAEIADRYQAAHPTIVKAIHKENGGHGSGVNTGLQNATGLYFKVVDSDDWVDTEAYQQILEKLREFARMEKPVDMLLSNYTYEHVEDGTSHTVRYTGKMPEQKIFGWDELGHFRPDQNILMHSVIYRTEMLRSSGLELPHHCFYVDNIFVYQPLPYVKTLYYMNVDFYRYFIGRSDQSVNEDVFIRQVDQQLLVTYHMLRACNPMQLEGSRKLRNYMLHYLSMMILVSSVFLVLSKTQENEEKRKQLWQDIRKTDEKLYRQLRYKTLCGCADMPVIRKRQVLGNGYRLARKIYKFN